MCSCPLATVQRILLGPAATCRQTCCTTDVLGILFSLMFQDVPFVALRLFLIFKYEVISYMHIFFTSKNTLVILMQIYRIFVLNFEKGKEQSPQLVVVPSSEKTGFLEAESPVVACRKEAQMAAITMATPPLVRIQIPNKENAESYSRDESAVNIEVNYLDEVSESPRGMRSPSTTDSEEYNGRYTNYKEPYKHASFGDNLEHIPFADIDCMWSL